MLTVLHVEAEVDHVAVLHGVVAALEAHLARGARPGHALRGDQFGLGHDLGADEAALDVAVDQAGGFVGRVAARQRPGARLFAAGDGEEGDEVEQGDSRPGSAG